MPSGLSAVERAYCRLKADILSGALPAGPLDIGQLGDRLRMSSTPVREALARLDAERLVRRELHGYVIARLSPARLEHLYQLSGALLDLSIDCASRPDCIAPPQGMSRTAAYPDAMTELLHEIAAGQANHELTAYAVGVTNRLLPARRYEPLVFTEAAQDLETIRSLWNRRTFDGLRVSLRAYHDSRIERAESLARFLAAETGDA